MVHQVPTKTKDERVAVLRKLDHKKRSDFYASRIGKVHPVLVETEKSVEGLAKGFTDNYIPVRFKTDTDVSNRIVAVRLEKRQEGFVVGTLL
jgi:threonylcarbamoyladenosine tRNA methylthiotransferase MtaB